MREAEYQVSPRPPWLISQTCCSFRCWFWLCWAWHLSPPQSNSKLAALWVLMLPKFLVPHWMKQLSYSLITQINFSSVENWDGRIRGKILWSFFIHWPWKQWHLCVKMKLHPQLSQEGWRVQQTVALFWHSIHDALQPFLKHIRNPDAVGYFRHFCTCREVNSRPLNDNLYLTNCILQVNCFNSKEIYNN